MSTIDVETYVADLAGDQPCGDNLEYDPDFIEFERLLTGKAESQFGDTIIAAEPPDWKAVRKLGLNLMGRTRDLRVVVQVCRALMHTDGVPGFADALLVLHGLIERAWPLLHPQLDPDDGNDPVMRVNAFAILCDPAATLNPLKDVVLAAVPAHGRFSLRDLDIANGDQPPPPGREKPSVGAIKAAFMEMPLDALLLLGDAAAGGAATVRSIERSLTRLAGAGQALDMSELARLLERIAEVARSRLAERPDRPMEAIAAVTDGAAAPGGNAMAAVTAPSEGVSGRVRSRDDAIKALGLVIDYYREFEPSSPIPLLLERARRMVPLGFLEIIRELAPDHLAELERIQGNPE